jgi:hypothetical protein
VHCSSPTRTLCANLCCWRLKLRELFSAEVRALVAKRCIVMEEKERQICTEGQAVLLDSSSMQWKGER